METFLQCWGGSGYLLAKVLLVRAEFSRRGRGVRLAGWLAYLLGVPAWVLVLAGRQDWIAAAIEAAGVPAIALGIATTWRQGGSPRKAVDWGIRLFTALMVVLGVSFSVRAFNGIKTLSQVLEIMIIFGYLVSNYLLAKRNPFAWLMFMVGLASMSALMYMQGKMILCVQQIVSLVPAAIGFAKNMQQRKAGSAGAKGAA